ncbi:MAG: ankyrin repeat domain-containing protein, partial [Rhodobacteraceae bacterium]|nr:ankyrin repeat domain-containing protein [Paracoccaceae bacterium]
MAKLKFATEAAKMDRDARAERLKIALYLGQTWIVEMLLDADPELVGHNLGLACALGEVPAVSAAVQADPEAATRIVGIRSPLLHAAFSKYHGSSAQAAADILEVVGLLVAAGADVNDSYPAEPGSEHRLSALYGALGHAGNLGLAEWLLDHGASPDDNESLYHATELGHLDGVRLLMKHRVTTTGTNALPRMLDFDSLEGVGLLLDYGADPNEAVTGHPSGQPVDTIPALHQAARRGRSGAFADLLLEHGADATAIWEGHTAYALARIYGNVDFARALEDAGHATTLSPIEAALADCADGARGVRLDSAQLDNEQARILTRLILWEDHLDHAKALVSAGIDPNVTEEMGMPPVHLAGWAGLPEQTNWLLSLALNLLMMSPITTFR